MSAFHIRLHFWLLAKAACSLCLLATLAGAGRGDASAEHFSQHISPALSAHASFPFAIADFDGDSQPDLATVMVGQTNASDTRYWIRLQLSSRPRQFIGITAPSGGLHLTPRDVNGDSFPDLVVTTSLLRYPIAVLLNDGQGNFTINDASRFPERAPESQRNSTSTAVPPKDAAAAILTNNSSGDHQTPRPVFRPRHERDLIVSADDGLPFLSLTISIFGRAPPRIQYT